MDDLTGMGKLADSKLANKAYDDGLSPAVRELGQLAVDAVKSLRLFTGPFQLAALAQDRLARWLEEIRNRVPEDRQVEAMPSIAGPAFRSLIFLEDGNPLTELFLQLLTRAIDKETVGCVHPAFVHIIEQLSPDEAMVLYILRRRDVTYLFPWPEGREEWERGFPTYADAVEFDLQRLAYPENFRAYWSHLTSLSLVKIHPRFAFRQTQQSGGLSREAMAVTDFGRLFIDTCIPDDFTREENGGRKTGQEESEEGK